MQLGQQDELRQLQSCLYTVRRRSGGTRGLRYGTQTVHELFPSNTDIL